MGICKIMRKIGKNKRGDLRDNVPEIIIAVLGILLIVFAVYQIYHVFVNSDNENAKKILNNVEAKINAVPEGQTGVFMVQGFVNADAWFLAAWSKGDSEDSKPDKCSSSSCLCICFRDKGASTKKLDNSYLKQYCSERGFCRKISIEKVAAYTRVGSTQRIVTDPTGLSLPVTDPARIIGSWIALEKNVIEVKVEKLKDTITMVKTSS